MYPDTFVVDVQGKTQLVNTSLIEDEIGVGDWVVIHMGFALERLSQRDAEEALELLNMLGPNAGAPPIPETQAFEMEPPPW